MLTPLQNLTAATYSGAATVSKTFGAMTSGSRSVVQFTMESQTDTVSIADNENAGNYNADSSAGSTNGTYAGYGQAICASIVNNQTVGATVTATITGGNTYGALKLFELPACTLNATASAGSTTSTGGNGGSGIYQLAISPASGDFCCAASTVYPGGETADTNYTLGFGPSSLFNSYHVGEYN